MAYLIGKVNEVFELRYEINAPFEFVAISQRYFCKKIALL